MGPLSVHVRFAGGFRWPLRRGDTVELWTPDHELAGEFDAAILLELLAVHLHTAGIMKALVLVAPAVALPPAPLGRKPPVKITPVVKTERRAQRRQRRRAPTG